MRSAQTIKDVFRLSDVLEAFLISLSVKLTFEYFYFYLFSFLTVHVVVQDSDLATAGLKTINLQLSDHLST